MAADSLDDLENEAGKRRRAGRGRNPGEPRFPRTAKPDDAEARRREEAQRRADEREKRLRAEREQPAPSEPVQVPDEPLPPATDENSSTRTKAKRPKSMPFYPNPEHEAFLWRITEAASARQKRIPATAVLRLALARLEEQMTPSEIVQLLGNAEQTDGKMGRPRL